MPLDPCHCEKCVKHGIVKRIDMKELKKEMRVKSQIALTVFLVSVLLLCIAQGPSGGMNPVQTVIAVPTIVSGISAAITFLFSL